MTPSNDFQLDDERLTPELSALEARLSDLTPRALPGAEETKRRGFLVWRGDNPRRRRELDAELAAAVVRFGERDVAEALRRYWLAARTTGFLFGLVCGLVGGGLASVFALQYCVRLVDARRDDDRAISVRAADPFYSNQTYRNPNDFNDLRRYPSAFSANAFLDPVRLSTAPFDSDASAPADSSDSSAVKEKNR